MTKKEFVAQVVEQILKNPRKVLAGHGISATVLQQIIKRPDVMGRLAAILWTLKTAKRGALGLKKTNLFQIKGYKNFPEMNVKAREDIENFVGGLSDADAEKFNNAGNVITVLLLPEKPAADQEVMDQVVGGKSVLVNFDTAVRKEYKIPGGMYLVVMVADSAVRPAEEKTAKRQKKQNERANKRRTPARLKAELKKKAQAKLALLKKKRDALDAQAYNLGVEAQQSQYLQNQFGEDILAGIDNMDADAAAAQQVRKNTLAGLRGKDKTAYTMGMALLKKGKKAAAKEVFSTMKNPDVVDVLNAQITSGTDKVNARKAALRKELRKYVQRGDQLLLDLSMAPENKKLSVRSMISKNNAMIKKLRAQLGTYKNLSAAGRANKAAMLAKVNADIEANIAEGATISQALNAAIAELNAKPQQKQVIKQQVMQQVADGMPIQYAVQQAVQQMPTDSIDTSLTNEYTVEDLMNRL